MQEVFEKNHHFELWYFDPYDPDNKWQLATHHRLPSVILRDINRMEKQGWLLDQLRIEFHMENDIKRTLTKKELENMI